MKEQRPSFPPPSPSLHFYALAVMKHVLGCVFGSVMTINVQEDTIGSVKQKIFAAPPGVAYLGRLPETGTIHLWIEFSFPTNSHSISMSQTHKINMPLLNDMKLKDIVPFYSSDYQDWLGIVDNAEPLSEFTNWHDKVVCKLCFNYCEGGKEIPMPSFTTLNDSMTTPTTQQLWSLPQDKNVILHLMQTMDIMTMCCFMTTCQELYCLGNTSELWKSLVKESLYIISHKNPTKRQRNAKESVYFYKILFWKQRLKRNLCESCNIWVTGKYKIACNKCGKVSCRFCSGYADWVLGEAEQQCNFICDTCSKK
eukprot:Phypoly_transcript_12501.p1 GENE.Phypoly_transcript_12501~~Phypoly_transcript_12501.p1  ORF type:complete len:344 (+),score=36.43 Phypoly_transcript_12501:105-1034(+)